jgi:flagellar biosynthesis GTPase FlhF
VGARRRAVAALVSLILVVAVGGCLLSPRPAQAINDLCQYHEPLPPQCVAELQKEEEERREEESAAKQWERERQEEKEKRAAEEAQEKEAERKEERERQARKRREQREASEWAVKPKVTQGIAHQRGLSLLHKKIPTWTYRKEGSLDCAGGKINRSQWRCRVSWIAGSVCHGGRLQVVGAGHRNGRAIYQSSIQYRSGYGYVRHGRIRCFFTEGEE